jgi:hypothetical protein
MADGTQGSPTAVVLLDEWHVMVFVERTIPTRSANRLRRQVHAELTAYADRLTESLGRASGLRIDVGQ